VRELSFEMLYHVMCYVCMKNETRRIKFVLRSAIWVDGMKSGAEPRGAGRRTENGRRQGHENTRGRTGATRARMINLNSVQYEQMQCSLTRHS
jgi:hypothetical protein